MKRNSMRADASVISQLKARGLKLRQCGNLFLVVSKELKTLFQTHSMKELESWLNLHPSQFLTDGINFNSFVDDRTHPVKYSRIIYL